MTDKSKIENANNVFSYTYLGVDLFHSAIVPSLRTVSDVTRALGVMGYITGPIGLAGAVAYGAATDGFNGLARETTGWAAGYKAAEVTFRAGLPIARSFGPAAPYAIAGWAAVSAVVGFFASDFGTSIYDAVADFVTSYSTSIVVENHGRFYSGWDKIDDEPIYSPAHSGGINNNGTSWGLNSPSEHVGADERSRLVPLSPTTSAPATAAPAPVSNPASLAPIPAPIAPVPLTPISAPMAAPVPRVPIAVPSVSMARPPSMPVPMTGVPGFASRSGSSGGYNDGRGDPAPFGGYGDSYGGSSGGGGLSTGGASSGGARGGISGGSSGGYASTPGSAPTPSSRPGGGSYSGWNGPDEGSRGLGASTSGGYQSGGNYGRDEADRAHAAKDTYSSKGPDIGPTPGAGGKSPGSAGFWGVPVLLDLDGNGLEVDPLSSSSRFVDLNGDGYQHRTAWAGKGDGVLILDADGDGRISRSSEFAFTEWDASADGDLDALRKVFDSNGNGKLDAGDARWSEFKVEVDGQLVSLASLGLASIDLTPTGSGQNFADGSAITGTAKFTRNDGTTGTAGDAVLAADAASYRIQRSTIVNADQSTTETVAGFNRDGSTAFTSRITTSADGSRVLTRFDDNGDGVFDRSQSDDLVVAANGTRTRPAAALLILPRITPVNPFRSVHARQNDAGIQVARSFVQQYNPALSLV